MTGPEHRGGGGGGGLASIDSLFSRAWEVYKRRAVSLISIVLISVFGGIALAALGFGPAVVFCFLKFQGWEIAAVVWGLIGGIALMLLVFLGQGAVFFAVSDEALGVGEAFRQALRRLPGFAWLMMVSSFVVVGAFLFFIVPGIVVSIWLSFAIFVFIREGRGGLDALLASREHMRGRFWPVTLRLFVLWLVSLGLGMVPLAGPVLQFLYFPFNLIAMCTLYEDVKRIGPASSIASSVGAKAGMIVTALLGYAMVPIAVLAIAAAVMDVPFTSAWSELVRKMKEQKLKGLEQMAPETHTGPPHGAVEGSALLEGEWRGTVSGEAGTWTLSIRGTEVVAEGPLDGSRIKGVISALDASANPALIDILVLDTVDDRHEGETSLGIFALEGDAMRICGGEPGSGKRPADLLGGDAKCFDFLRSSVKQPGAIPEMVPEMVHIKGGCFGMGDSFGDGGADERPVHYVCLDEYRLDAREVSQREYEESIGENPSRFKGGGRPVTNVSWHDALRYCALKEKRLPTEAEWEYAARAGGSDVRWSGTGDEEWLERYAWLEKPYGDGPRPVGALSPNELGLFDMTGNAWEFVSDRYAADYYAESPERNPGGPEAGRERVIRGGAWFNTPRDSRATVRNTAGEGVTGDAIGFRCARGGDSARPVWMRTSI